MRKSRPLLRLLPTTAVATALFLSPLPHTPLSEATAASASAAAADDPHPGLPADPPTPAVRRVDAVDPTPANNPGGLDSQGACFPGCRGVDQLLVYTPAYGQPSTRTNAYGIDVVVRQGRVTAVGGNDRTIPADGLVLSGHGQAARWLTDHSVVGALVTLDGNTLTITTDGLTAVMAAEVAAADAHERLVTADGACTVFPRKTVRDELGLAEELIGEARALFEAGRQEEATRTATQALSRARAAADGTRASRPAEGRGVWVRPTETTPEAIRAAVDRIKASGFTMVFLETVWQGYTIYPSKVAAAAGIEDQRPSMRGFDPLKVWIDAAHERGMELHAWTHTFFVGADSAEGRGPGPVLSAHPEWAAVEREDVGAAGPRPSSQEKGYYFVDPAHPGARSYIASVFTELLTEYAIDGLHLDYIRYPVSLPYDAGFSYSDTSRAAFARDHGADPYTLTEHDPLWPVWNAWRERNVTTFVADVRATQERLRPGAALSAAVFADPVDGQRKKFQNWGAWVDAGYMDFLTGMSFGTSPSSVGQDTAVMRRRVGDVPLYTATYGPFHGSSSSLIGDQLQAVNDADSDGSALFASNQLTDVQAAALAKGVYRTPATAPHADPIAATRTLATDLVQRVDAATGRCVSRGEAAPVRARLTAAAALLRTGAPAAHDAAARLLEAALDRAVGWGTGENPGFRDGVTRDLRMAQRWLRTSKH
ncbi:family 10 glycosylhydrolase [Streptomyces sp. NPDC002057]|uniref:glycoside hydrolase family 10 protein n=1 Tax=Streptomyces sp. NPDC002057 TaxID=3154664 RepID=UPI003323E312